MDLGIKDKVALITGGSRGIGYEVVVGLLAEGAKVVFCSSNASDIETVSAALNQDYPNRILGVCTDLSKEGDRTKLVARAKDQFGDIEILVNNAGIVGRTVPPTELAISEWRQVFEVNFFAAVDLCAQVIPGMKEKNWGRIINISSENGEQPDPNMPHYNATKAALNNLSKTLAGSYGDANILVNTVAPAFIKTPMAEEVITGFSAENNVEFDEGVKMFLKANRPGIVLNRFGTPREVASAVLFLASTHASFMTGSVLRVDGGSVMSV